MVIAPEVLAALSPLVQQIVPFVGRLATDPELTAFVTTTLCQKTPTSSTPGESLRYVVAKKMGLDLGFGHDVLHEQYPLVPKSKSSHIPYLRIAWLKPKFQEPLPFGLTFEMEREEITKRLGVDPVERVRGVPVWTRVLDASRAVVFKWAPRECWIGIDEARVLSSRHGVPAKPVVGVFITWAARQGLIDPSRVGIHNSMLEEVRTGARKGSELLFAAWPRGVWDIHLIDRPGLRDFAYCWFHNMDGISVRDDFIAVFGERQGQHGLRETAIDDDSEEAVDRARVMLDTRFASWVS